MEEGKKLMYVKWRGEEGLLSFSFGVPAGATSRAMPARAALRRHKERAGGANPRVLARDKYTKTPLRKSAGASWCTRRGSNPESTASEAVMLSNYTTSTL